VAKDLRVDVVSGSDDRGLVTAAAGLDLVADKADKAGRSFDKMAAEGGILAVELEATKLKAKDLAAQFDKTGDRSFLKQSQGAARYAKQLESVGKNLGTIADEAEKDTQGFQGIQDALFSAAPFLAPLLAPVAAGSLLAVLGGGGLALGIAGQFSSPIVKDALTNFETEAGGTLHTVTSGYAVELAGTLKTLEQGTVGFLHELKPGLDAIRPALGDISKDVSAGLLKAGPIFARALAGAKPVLDDVGQSLETLTVDTAQAFEGMTIGAHGAGEAIKDLTGEVGNLIVATGDGLGAISAAYGLIHDTSDKVNSTMEGTGSVGKSVWDSITKSVGNTLNPIGGAVDGVKGLHDEFDKSKGAVIDVASEVDGLTNSTNQSELAATRLKKQWDAIDAAVSNELAKDTALDLLTSATKDWTAALKANGDTIDQNTAKGRANRELYANEIATLKQQRDELYRNTGDATKADNAFQGWVKTLDAAMKKAGLTDAQIRDLNKDLELIPKTITFTIHGKVGLINTSTGVGITDVGIKFLAAGGRYEKGMPRVVGEHGPEFDIPDHSGVIVPNNALRGSSSVRMPGSAGGGSGRVEVVLSAGDQAAAALLGVLRPEIRSQYGGNVNLALGGYR
jgi:hypothetical protein